MAIEVETEFEVVAGLVDGFHSHPAPANSCKMARQTTAARGIPMYE